MRRRMNIIWFRRRLQVVGTLWIVFTTFFGVAVTSSFIIQNEWSPSTYHGTQFFLFVLDYFHNNNPLSSLSFLDPTGIYRFQNFRGGSQKRWTRSCRRSRTSTTIPYHAHSCHGSLVRDLDFPDASEGRQVPHQNLYVVGSMWNEERSIVWVRIRRTHRSVRWDDVASHGHIVVVALCRRGPVGLFVCNEFVSIIVYYHGVNLFRFLFFPSFGLDVRAAEGIKIRNWWVLVLLLLIVVVLLLPTTVSAYSSFSSPSSSSS